MQTRSVGVLVASTITLFALGACRNGPNNNADTNGIGAASGQLAPADSTSVAPPAVAPGTTPDTTGAAAMTPDTLGAPNSGTDTIGVKAADTSAKKTRRHSSKKR